MAESRRILVADGDEVVRAAVRLLLARNPRLRVVAEVESLEDLRRESAALELDVVLLDMNLRGLTVDELRSLCSAAVTVVFSTREEQRMTAIEAGAVAFVCKSESPRQLLTVLETVATTAAT
jgi:DNA-binding NarL/FixJ family response regulator